MIELEGKPSDWIARAGRPARWCGERGMPSYESEDGKLLVFDVLCVKDGGDIPPMLLPRSYMTACVIAPDGLVPVSHGGSHTWRPQVYTLVISQGGWVRMSSQTELTWRQGLSEVVLGMLEASAQGLYGDEARDYVTASSEVGQDAAWDRAEQLLQENLSPFQEFEYALTGEFRVRGAKTGNLYLIRPGNGFALIDPVTSTEIASYCLHPEYWLPDADVALATKLALEDPDLEVECLENARTGGASSIGTPYRPTLAQRAAAERERELIT